MVPGAGMRIQLDATVDPFEHLGDGGQAVAGAREVMGGIDRREAGNEKERRQVGTFDRPFHADGLLRPPPSNRPRGHRRKDDRHLVTLSLGGEAERCRSPDFPAASLSSGDSSPWSTALTRR